MDLDRCRGRKDRQRLLSEIGVGIIKHFADMEKNISGLSFYDFLNKMIPGYLIYNCISKDPLAFRRYTDVSETESLCLMFVIIVSFVFGIVYEWILRGFNELVFRAISCLCCSDKEADDCKGCFANALCCLFGSNDRGSIRIGYRRVYKQLWKSSAGGADIRDTYLAAYYNVEKNGCLGNIPILEALSRFCKQIIVPFVLWELLYLNVQGSQGYIVFWNIFAVILLCLLSISFQHKICELVWEGDKYLGRENPREHYISPEFKIRNASISIDSSTKSVVNTGNSSVDSIEINN